MEEEINTTTSYNYNPNGTLKEVTTEGESYKETLEYKWEGYKMNVDRKVYNYKDGNMIREDFSSSLYHIYTYGDKINKFPENYFLYGGRDEPSFCAFNFPVSIFSSKNLPTSAEFYNKYYDRYVLSEKRTYKYEFDNMGRVTKIIEFYQKFNQDGSPDGERKKQPSIIFVY